MLLMRQEGGIMIMSWVHFWPQGPPRRQVLQNQLPEAGGEHHEHQLGTFLATGPS